MSFPPQDPRRRRIPAAGAGFSPTGRRTAMGYWVPLAMTVGVATLAIAAWIWSERNDDDEGDYPPPRDDGYGRDGFPGPGPEDVPPIAPPGGVYGGEYGVTTGPDIPRDEDEASMMARMQGALRRTPSPQQIFDGASRKVAAGVAAAGAFMGGALTSIREEDRGDFEDHSRWSEEVQSRAAERSQATASMSGAQPTRGPVTTQPPFDKKRKTVAIVVSSEARADSEGFGSEHAVCYINFNSRMPANSYSPSYPTSPRMSTLMLRGFSF